MATTMTIQERAVNTEISTCIGSILSFNNSLKLSHWHITGTGSYSKHIALDQAIGSLTEISDRLVETTYAMNGNLNITIPETRNPLDILNHAIGFYEYVQTQRKCFSEEFTQSIIDDYQEAIQQLVYRMKRLQ